MKIYFKTLGCDKNFVDTEKIAGLLNKRENHQITNNIDQSDIVIINTCSFIDEAVEENINTILEFVNYKKINDLSYRIVVIGCLPELYRDELKKEIPEVHNWIIPGEYHKIAEILSDKKKFEIKEKNKQGFLGDSFPRTFLNDSHYKFLKISDGCNLSCSYCIIPKIRGNFKSRNLKSLQKELNFIEKNKDVKEVIIVSQNTSFFGTNNRNYDIIDLLDLLGEYKFFWKRLMYLDIRKINEKFLDAMKRNKILPYFDIPLQHISDKVLKDMNRNYTLNDITNKINLIKKYFKNPLLRTTFIVGFPTEKENDFKQLLDFVKKDIFHRIGIFEYSHQPLSLAYEKFKDNISPEVKTERFNILNKAAENSIKKDLSRFTGEKMDVLIDSESSGRTWRDAPEIDSCVRFNNQHLKKGKIYRTILKNVLNLEIEGEILNEIYT